MMKCWKMLQEERKNRSSKGGYVQNVHALLTQVIALQNVVAVEVSLSKVRINKELSGVYPGGFFIIGEKVQNL